MGYSDISELSDKEISDIFLKKEEPDKDRLAIIQQRMPEFEKDLAVRGVTKFLLWEEYKSTYPGGYNYTQFCHHLNNYLKKNEAVMHFDHKAGDKVFIDFTGQKLPITDPETGEVSYMEIFAAILGLCISMLAIDLFGSRYQSTERRFYQCN
jgi:hypothetical protein